MGYQGRVLIVEDDTAQRRMFAGLASAGGWKVDEAADGESALDLLGRDLTPDIVLLDLVLPGIDGFDVLQRIRARGHLSPVVMMTADGSIARAVEAIRNGASDFLVKPIAQAQLIQTLSECATPIGAASVSDVARERDDVTGVVAAAPAMRRALRTALRAAPSRIPVMILGESGTGKEVFAQTIHDNSGRGAGEFVAVNCGALPEQLVESLLFGHARGAFTGADKAAAGLIRSADRGTLFLDEIGELPLNAQVKLLRFLQEGVVTPVGADPVSVDVRVISATNRNPKTEIAAGTFREDLYFRVAGVEITLPPLRERTTDIPALANLHALAVAHRDRLPFDGFSPAATRWLLSQPWPGNVRELQNAVYRALVLSDEAMIDVDAFLIGPGGVLPTAEESETAGIDLSPDVPVRALRDLEAVAIAHALTVNDGHISRAAKALGIGRTTLYRKITEYGLDV